MFQESHQILYVCALHNLFSKLLVKLVWWSNLCVFGYSIKKFSDLLGNALYNFIWITLSFRMFSVVICCDVIQYCWTNNRASEAARSRVYGHVYIWLTTIFQPQNLVSPIELKDFYASYQLNIRFMLCFSVVKYEKKTHTKPCHSHSHYQSAIFSSTMWVQSCTIIELFWAKIFDMPFFTPSHSISLSLAHSLSLEFAKL